MAVVTVAIPVLNGARYLDEVLAAVRNQRLGREPRAARLSTRARLTDRSRSLDSTAPDSPDLSIKEFSHGGTRNLDDGDRTRRARRVLNPRRNASQRGLARRISPGFRADRRCCPQSSGRTTRAPSASHMIQAEMERHFENWGTTDARSMFSASTALRKDSRLIGPRPWPSDLSLERQLLSRALGLGARALPATCPTPRINSSAAS